MRAVFDHLIHLSDEIGTFEHADHSEPRMEHGYCVDDVARVLIVVCNHDGPVDRRLADLEDRSLDFIFASIDQRGAVRNRRNVHGVWTSDAGTGDWWGRALWALGVCARRGRTAASRDLALRAFSRCAEQTSTSPRALGFATLGAAEVTIADPSHDGALSLAADFISWFDRRSRSDAWPWPEERLAYANAVICDALIAAGHVADRLDLVRRGLELLAWLTDRQTINGHLSPVPVGGGGPDDTGPRFDQQPIEVARLADAYERAHGATADENWIERVQLCADWFNGRNDIGVAMWRPDTGAGFDGLTRKGVNLNQGAESTLAAISTAQAHRRLQTARRLHVTGS